MLVTLRRSVSSICATALLLQATIQPSFAQASTPATKASGCSDLPSPIFLAERRITVRGVIRACPSSYSDVTGPPNAPSAGEQLMIAGCRYRDQYPGAVVRARPNQAYFLRPGTKDMEMVPAVSRRAVNWDSAVRALPFVPTKIVSMGQQKGYPIFGYTELRFLPSRINEAYPLNSSSVILSIDGCAFNTADALAAILAGPYPHPFVEVGYFQRDDPNRIFYRAYIPMYPRSAVTTEWGQLTRTYPIFDRDRSGQVMGVAAFMAFSLLVYAFTQSALGKQLAREREDCLKRFEPLDCL